MAILNDTHLAKVNAALDQLAQAENELALAKRAGISPTVQGQSIADLESKIGDLQAKLRQIKNTYFPNAG